MPFPMFYFHKTVRIFIKPPHICPYLPVCLQMKSIHSFWILLLFSLNTFGSPHWFDTQQEQRCMLFVRFLLRWWRPVALSELLGGEWGGLTPSKASITIRHEMALALFEKELICKKVMWLWEGKRRIFGAKTTFFVCNWRFSTCVWSCI